MACRRILFDMDGTLVDSSPGIVAAMRHALAAAGIGGIEETAVRSAIGQPLLPMIRSLLPQADGAQVDRLAVLYREYFSARGVLEARVYEGVPAMLDRLGRAGLALHVVTSKPAPFVERVCEAFGFTGHFASIHAPSLGFAPRKKAGLIAELLDAYQAEPGTCLMVGDRAEDVTAARQNGVDCLGVTYGFGTREELENAGAIGVVHSSGQAAEWIARHRGPLPEEETGHAG